MVSYARILLIDSSASGGIAFLVRGNCESVMPVMGCRRKGGQGGEEAID